MRAESVYIGKEVSSLSIALVHQHVLPFHCFGSESYLKAKAIQSRVRKQNNFTSFGNKSMLSPTPIPYVSREQA